MIILDILKSTKDIELLVDEYEVFGVPPVFRVGLGPVRQFKPMIHLKSDSERFMVSQPQASGME
jgi:hypothetical protein